MDHLWRETPLLYSKQASDRMNCDVYLKLENLQHMHSFKYRGISLFAQEALKVHGPSAHLIVASGGNAAYATCGVALALQMKCTAFVPLKSASVKPLLEAYGATVQVGGDNFQEALNRAKEAVASDPNAVLVPAYDHPTLWKGHSSLIKEISKQLPDESRKPDAIVCAVGGGGLLAGIILGCQEVEWDDVTILGMETQGSNCFYQSMLVNRTPAADPSAIGNSSDTVQDEKHQVKVSHLHRLTSKALCLGATSPTTGAVRLALDRRGLVRCVCTTDEMSVKASVDYLNEQKQLVELACATALVPAYDARILKSVSVLQDTRARDNKRPLVVFVVCGGANVNLDEMVAYNQMLRDLEETGRDPYADPFWLDGTIVS
ncbi:hypothetical protein FS837_006717 [Tulasnella sp. UAMH 9824]|nr:hypothetical protein FS837_006717 [Tulasnella sp. UAMH 9824]